MILIIFLWVFVTLVFLFNVYSLLVSLIILEIHGFLIILAVSFYFVSCSDFICLALFAFFVIEGVIGLSGLISLVLFTGSDFISVHSILNI